MSILNKQLNAEETALLDLFLNGALAPLDGFMGRDDHTSVLTCSRLANGYLWPLPLALALSPAEKRQAQLNKRIALLDDEQRVLAEVELGELYRLPADVAEQAGKSPDTWYAAGAIKKVSKVLHPVFNRIRHDTHSLQNNLHENGWSSVIAVSGTLPLDQNEMQQACQWLKAGTYQAGGILLQVGAGEANPELHHHMRELRSLIRCNAAKQVKLSVIPEISGLDEKRSLLLQALIAKNYGATGFLISTTTSASARNWVLRHRDEIGLDLRPAKRYSSTHAAKPKRVHQGHLLKLAA